MFLSSIKQIQLSILKIFLHILMYIMIHIDRVRGRRREVIVEYFQSCSVPLYNNKME